MKFRFTIFARLRGALGVQQQHVVEVEVPEGKGWNETYNAAALKLYDTHEHVHILKHEVIETRGFPYGQARPGDSE